MFTYDSPENMDQAEFDRLGQVIVPVLRRIAGCDPRNCRTELYYMPVDIDKHNYKAKAHLHHGSRWQPAQANTYMGHIAVIVKYTPRFGESLVRQWRAEHGMVDLLPDRPRMSVGILS